MVEESQDVSRLAPPRSAPDTGSEDAGDREDDDKFTGLRKEAGADRHDEVDEVDTAMEDTGNSKTDE